MKDYHEIVTLELKAGQLLEIATLLGYCASCLPNEQAQEKEKAAALAAWATAKWSAL